MEFGSELAARIPSHEIRFSFATGNAVSHNVNTLIDAFRSDSRNEWFVWWDERVQITPEQLAVLLTAQRHVVGALYTNTQEEPNWMASFYPGMLPDETGILPVPELREGAKVFHRSVFDLIETKSPGLDYIFDHSGKTVPAFCQETLVVFGEYKRLLCPAYHLDHLCRLAGIQVFAHTKTITKFLGTNGALYPKAEPYRPWSEKPLPPPQATHELNAAPPDARPIKVFIQYCDKDAEQADRLNKIIPYSHLVYSAGDKYPKGPNETALKLLRMKHEGYYKAVLLLEPDCVPMCNSWLDQLSNEWDKCAAEGKLILGSWHPINRDHPAHGHLNGALMFSPELGTVVDIPNVPDDKPWDTWLARTFQPHWMRTGLIKNLNKHRTATKRQLAEPECGENTPVLIHGVRDDSAWRASTLL